MIEKPPIAVEKIRSRAESEIDAVGVRDGGDAVAAEVDDVLVRIVRLAGGRIGALHDVVEELVRRADVVLDTELLQVGPVDEDQLGLDRR